jgi:hypothetical protein
VSGLSEQFEQLADGPLLSRPTLRRSTPITTTGLRFIVRLGLDGVQEMTLVD